MQVRKEMVEPLVIWYQENARELPWRKDKNPYTIWISEIMLQQTRVEAVKPYFTRFINMLPSVEELAIIPEDHLLKLWEGLGYYNRVRNMQKAAKIMVEKWNGEMPNSYEELLALPGIGTYTAGAIASIAYKELVPAIDGNVLRVIARVEANESDIADPKVKKQLELAMGALIKEWVLREKVGDFNQALMELGATICVPNGIPKCEVCPWNLICKSLQTGDVTRLPIKSSKKKRIIEEKTILVIQDQNKVILRKREQKGLLAGLYEFPSIEGHKEQKDVLSYMKQLGYPALRIELLEASKHIFSHREWHMIAYHIRVDQLVENEELVKRHSSLQFIDLMEMEQHYPIPAAFVRYAAYLNIRLGQDKYR